jgi:hypothetical protein
MIIKICKKTKEKEGMKFKSTGKAVGLKCGVMQGGLVATSSHWARALTIGFDCGSCSLV